MYWHKNNFLIEWLYPSFVWHKPVKEKIIYLTFDDGPIPELTEWVLDILQHYYAKATFFCVGDNIRKHPLVFDKVKQGGHSIGNHTFNHLNGWKTDKTIYLENVSKFGQIAGHEVCLFRPPYGKVSRSQAAAIRQSYQIIMWDVLSGDFDNTLPAQICLQKSIQYTQKGTIIVFHDSLKAQRNLQFVLPRYLQHFHSLGYSFEKL